MKPTSRISSLLLAALLMVLLIVPAGALAAGQDDVLQVIGTNGVPVDCGTAARMIRENLQQDVYPRLYEDGQELPADALAHTGLEIRFADAAESSQTLVILGDVQGTGRYDIAQMVAFARLWQTDTWTQAQRAAAELDSSPQVTIADLVMLAGYCRDSRPQAPSEPYPAPDEDHTESQVLVAYFSASGTTARIAGYIADILDADTFEIEPQQPYTSADLNYNNPDSRVSLEHADTSLQDIPLVNAQAPDFEQYDTVYIGFPIWWGLPAWPVNGFVRANDFSGKNVICFCTSGGSGIGQSVETLAAIADGGNWLPGSRFSGAASPEQVEQWLLSQPDA